MNWTCRQNEAAEALLAMTFEVPTNPKLLNMALQCPFRMKKKETYTRVIWDSGASSISISPPSKEDFVGEFFTTPTLVQLQGLAKGLKIRGQGRVMWAFRDTEEQLRMIKVPAYYVPSTNVRLLSTTSLLQTYEPENILVEAHQLTLSGTPGDPTRGSVIAQVDPKNNLPTSNAYRYDDTMSNVNALSATLSVVSVENSNLSPPEKELLRWHFRLGHLSFWKVQFLMRTGVLATSQDLGASEMCSLPVREADLSPISW